jgi:hypothetical protein
MGADTHLAETPHRLEGKMLVIGFSLLVPRHF